MQLKVYHKVFVVIFARVLSSVAITIVAHVDTGLSYEGRKREEREEYKSHCWNYI